MEQASVCVFRWYFDTFGGCVSARRYAARDNEENSIFASKTCQMIREENQKIYWQKLTLLACGKWKASRGILKALERDLL